MKAHHKAVIDSLIRQLAARRKALDLSHETLAQRAGLSRAAVSFIEARKREPTLLTLLLIAEALDCRLDTLLAKACAETKKQG